MYESLQAHGRSKRGDTFFSKTGSGCGIHAESVSDITKYGIKCSYSFAIGLKA